MKQLLPLIFVLFLGIALLINIMGLMQLIPLFITLPILFISIYFILYLAASRNRTPKRMR